MKTDSRKARRRALLRMYGKDAVNSIVDRRIRTGRSLEGLTKAERDYCVMVLRASSHAAEMTTSERAAYHKARAVYRALLARRRRR